MIRRFLVLWRGARMAKMSDLHAVIMRVHRVQTWFLRNRGLPLAKWSCAECGKERLFTIWTDGRYHCLACLYGQALEDRAGPIELRTSAATMRDFAASWLEYRRRFEAHEDPWVPSHDDIMMMAHLTRLRPPPACTVDACETCGGLRPFMRHEDGGAGCIHCLMHGRIVEFEIEVADRYAVA
ncbi:MAG TPA: hypothetical protein VJ694_02390 [Patescibacteria group bacterium]|nr:hypothetical protein [Patescibacteria group bacterium]